MKYTFQSPIDAKNLVEIHFIKGVFRRIVFPEKPPKVTGQIHYIAGLCDPKSAEKTRANFLSRGFKETEESAGNSKNTDNKVAIWCQIYKQQTGHSYEIPASEVGILSKLDMETDLFRQAIKIYISQEKTRAIVRFFMVKINEMTAAAKDSKDGKKRLSAKGTARWKQTQARIEEIKKQEERAATPESIAAGKAAIAEMKRKLGIN